jgi:glutamate--cysteine ligase
MRQTQAHADYFRSRAPSPAELAQFEAAAQQSLERQAAMEAEDELDFDSFVAEYQRSLSL